MIKNLLKDIKEQWCNTTPKIAKWIRNLFASLSVVLPTAYATFKAMDITMPTWFNDYYGYLTILTLVITGVSGTKETAEAKAERKANKNK